MDGRSRFSYPSFGGFRGYGPDMGDPTESVGGQALGRMASPGPPQRAQSDPLWDEIQGTFNDILGEYANMELDMPIQPPDMSDPQDQLRYLKDLEALGMSSAPSAALMGRQGMDLKQSLELLKFQHKMQQDKSNMLMKLIPALEGNKELQAMFSAELLNSMMPGQFDVQDQSTFGGLFGETPGVERLTPETAREGMVYKGISGAALPDVLKLMEAKDQEGLNTFLEGLIEQMVEGGVNPEVAEAIADGIYTDALGQIKAKEPVY